MLILGRRRQLCTAREIPVADSVPILRAYLRRWKFEIGHVLRRRHARLHRRRVGRRGRRPPGLRAQLRHPVPSTSGGPGPAWGIMTPMSGLHGGVLRKHGRLREHRRRVRGAARPPHPHRVQPRADPLGQPRRAGGERRGRAVRGRDLDPGRGQRRLPLRRLAERRRARGARPTRSSRAWPAASPSRCATAARTTICASPARRPAWSPSATPCPR